MCTKSFVQRKDFLLNRRNTYQGDQLKTNATWVEAVVGMPGDTVRGEAYGFESCCCMGL